MAERSIHDEPVRGQFLTAEALGLSGMELARGFQDGSIPGAPFTRLSGLRSTEVGPGLAAFTMPAGPWWQSAAGVFPAGVYAFLADAPMASSVLTALPPGVFLTTSQLSMEFLRTATIRSGSLNARSRVIHLTRTLALSDVVVEDGTGRMMAHGTSRCFLFQTDETMLPEPLPVPHDDGTPDPHLRPVEGDVRSQGYWNERSGEAINREGVEGRIAAPVIKLLGLSPRLAEPGAVVTQVRNSPWTRNGMGVTYGGALSLGADLTMNLAMLGTLPAATAFAPLDLKVSFLRPVRPTDGEITVRASVNYRGRSIALITCEVSNAAGQLVAVASESVLVLPGRPWDRAIAVSEESVLADERQAPLRRP